MRRIVMITRGWAANGAARRLAGLPVHSFGLNLLTKVRSAALRAVQPKASRLSLVDRDRRPVRSLR